MARQPLVSVVIPTFNRGPFVELAVESALAQTWQEVEVIVIDDGSTDDTAERLARFGDAIQYHHQENLGVQFARNRAVGLARGEFTAMLDSDDLWLPEKLALDLAMFSAEPELALVYGRMEVIDENGTRTGVRKPTDPPGGVVAEVLVRGSGLSSTFIFRREVYDLVGGFDEAIARFTDLDFTLAVLRQHRIGVYDEPRALYRDHSGNLSKDIFGIRVGRYHLVRKWRRRFTEREHRRVMLQHERECSRKLARDYLKRGDVLQSLRFTGAYLRTLVQRP